MPAFRRERRLFPLPYDETSALFADLPDHVAVRVPDQLGFQYGFLRLAGSRRRGFRTGGESFADSSRFANTRIVIQQSVGPAYPLRARGPLAGGRSRQFPPGCQPEGDSGARAVVGIRYLDACKRPPGELFRRFLVTAGHVTFGQYLQAAEVCRVRGDSPFGQSERLAVAAETLMADGGSMERIRIFTDDAKQFRQHLDGLLIVFQSEGSGNAAFEEIAAAQR